MTDSVLVLRGLEELYPEIRMIERLRHCIETYPNENWGDVMSRGQMTSKLWILHQLQHQNLVELGNVVICGGWVGMLARLLMDCPDIYTAYIESLDIDVVATTVAGELNREYTDERVFHARVVDCVTAGYFDFDTIINTSCEHFGNFDEWWQKVPQGKTVILQSNDYSEPEDHVNCVQSAEELEATVGMSKVYYSGQLQCIKYKRFMVIGVR